MARPVSIILDCDPGDGDRFVDLRRVAIASHDRGTVAVP
jgi:hypothetical protein